MSQFNAAEVNKLAAQDANNEVQVNIADSQLQATISQFNSTLSNDRDKYNSTMGFATDQSNVLWRRNINTANTAAVNAAALQANNVNAPGDHRRRIRGHSAGIAAADAGVDCHWQDRARYPSAPPRASHPAG